jgi:hypothetical protein
MKARSASGNRSKMKRVAWRRAQGRRELGGVDRLGDHGGGGGLGGRDQRTEHHALGRQRQLVAIVQRMPRAGREAFVAHEGAVARVQVFDEPGGAAPADARMAAADGLARDAEELVGLERILALAPDDDFVVQGKHRRLVRLRVQQFEVGRGASWWSACSPYERCWFHRRANPRERPGWPS